MKLLDLSLKQMFISNHSKIIINKSFSLYGNVILYKVKRNNNNNLIICTKEREKHTGQMSSHGDMW